MTWTNFNTTSGSSSSIQIHVPTYVGNLDQPMLIGTGDPEFSTDTDVLVREALVCWDVNGYYRDLGVHWKATKRQLFVAYRDGGGPDDRRKTFVFKQLLNDRIRRNYDLAPLGSRYLDRYVMEELTRELKLKMAAAGLDTADDDNLRRAFAEFGFEAEGDTPGDDLAEGVDKDASETEDVSDPPEILPVEVPFQYPYYQWRSHCSDLDRLSVWQSMLVTAFAEKGVKVRLSVGYLGRMAHSWIYAVVGRRTVVYLNEKQDPTPEMAEAAAHQISTEQ